MSWKENVADYLQFSRKERIAIITLVLLITSLLFLPELVPRLSGRRGRYMNPDTSWIAAMKQLEKPAAGPFTENADDNSNAYPYDRAVRTNADHTRGELFFFDPNTLGEPGWKKLGLREKTIRTIINFRSKGGRFRQPGDLKRIYGLFPDEYERIAPYIQIAGVPEAVPYKEYPSYPEKPATASKEKYAVVDINTADTTAFIALPGIGSKLATRITSFREKLGGFYSTGQVAETFGLADSTFQKIRSLLKLENINLRKININTATLDELKAHPYIRYQLANPIIAYRKEHGPFAKLEDLKKVMAVSDEVFRKISPYLAIE